MSKSRHFGLVVAMVALTAASAYARSNRIKLGKTGHLTLAHQTTVGNTVLSPGYYEVRHRRSASGHFVEFTRIWLRKQRGASVPYEWKVVARVPCTIEPPKPLKTRIVQTSALISGAGAPHLYESQIRGENVVHVFPAGYKSAVPQGGTNTTNRRAITLLLDNQQTFGSGTGRDGIQSYSFVAY